MPVKRRRPKYRVDSAAELAAWAPLFDSGYDFFGDLAPFGFPGGDADEAVRAAAPEAWRRLGAAYLTSELYDPSRACWALETFGRPPCR